MAKTIQKLTEFWKQVLQESDIIENRLYLKTQMDRKQYAELNKVLELLGGKWNRWQKCHIFEIENLKEAINEICDTMEVVNLKVLYQQYYTPKELAKRVVELADIKPTDSILEPSAWQGAIVDEILKKEYSWIVLNELDPNNIKILKEKYNVYEWMKDMSDNQGTYSSEKKMNIYNWDFLEANYNDINKIIMNPPFTKSQDVKHILKAYSLLQDSGRLVSIASSSIQHRTGKLYDELRALNPEFIEVWDWAFKESWTMVSSVIVVINK